MGLHALWSACRSITVADGLDMAVVSCFIYALLRLFEWTKAAAIARGILILGALYVVARQLGMVLTTWFFHGFFAVFIIALVIIFQEEFRRFFERLAVWSVRPHVAPFQSGTVDLLVRCISQCAHERTGVLLVLCGKEPLERHLEGGFELDGKLSDALLLSIFDVHSDGHDGAMIIENGRLRKFGVHLPLSKNLELLSGLGTRHAAALGLSEMTDTMCIVVSEQKGTISIALRGDLRPVAGPQELERRIAKHLHGSGERQNASGWMRWLFRNKREKAFALFLSFILWLVFVQGFRPETRTFSSALLTQNVPAGLHLARVSPHQVVLTVSGFKRNLDDIDPARTHVHIDLEDQDAGTSRLPVEEDDVRLPTSVRLVKAEPAVIVVTLEGTPSQPVAQ